MDHNLFKALEAVDFARKELEQARSRITELENELKATKVELEQAKDELVVSHGKIEEMKLVMSQECTSAPKCCDPTCPVHGNPNVVISEPLPSVPMPEKLPPLDYYSLEEGRRRGYCK